MARVRKITLQGLEGQERNPSVISFKKELARQKKKLGRPRKHNNKKGPPPPGIQTLAERDALADKNALRERWMWLRDWDFEWSPDDDFDMGNYTDDTEMAAETVANLQDGTWVVEEVRLFNREHQPLEDMGGIVSAGQHADHLPFEHELTDQAMPPADIARAYVLMTPQQREALDAAYPQLMEPKPWGEAGDSRYMHDGKKLTLELLMVLLDDAIEKGPKKEKEYVKEAREFVIAFTPYRVITDEKDEAVAQEIAKVLRGATILSSTHSGSLLHNSNEVDEALEEVGKILRESFPRFTYHGVETLTEGAINPNGYSSYGRASLSYLNRGDAYDTTVAYDWYAKEFFFGSWGDWLEEYERKHPKDFDHGADGVGSPLVEGQQRNWPTVPRGYGKNARRAVQQRIERRRKGIPDTATRPNQRQRGFDPERGADGVGSPLTTGERRPSNVATHPPVPSNRALRSAAQQELERRRKGIPGRVTRQGQAMRAARSREALRAARAGNPHGDTVMDGLAGRLQKEGSNVLRFKSIAGDDATTPGPWWNIVTAQVSVQHFGSKQADRIELTFYGGETLEEAERNRLQNAFYFEVEQSEEFLAPYGLEDPDTEEFIFGEGTLGENATNYLLIQDWLKQLIHDVKFLHKAFPDRYQEIVKGPEDAYKADLARARSAAGKLGSPPNSPPRRTDVQEKDSDEDEQTYRELRSGYTDCPCRDCFDVSMNDQLCSDCEEAGCDASGESECQRDDAYGVDEKELAGTLRPTSSLPSDPAFVYHATNEERARDIASAGLKLHKPNEFTDQDVWPDGSVEKRIYFSPTAAVVWQFAPEEGKAVVLRVRRAGLKLKGDGTGDMFVREKVPTSAIEVLTDAGWEPLSSEALDGLKGVEGFSTVWEIKKRNADTGGHYFDKNAMRAFSSRVSEDLYGGVFFVSSEQHKNYSSVGKSDPRAYSVRYATDDGKIHDASAFQAYETLAQAKSAAKKFAAGKLYPRDLAAHLHMYAKSRLLRLQKKDGVVIPGIRPRPLTIREEERRAAQIATGTGRRTDFVPVKRRIAYPGTDLDVEDIQIEFLDPEVNKVWQKAYKKNPGQVLNLVQRTTNQVEENRRVGYVGGRDKNPVVQARSDEDDFWLGFYPDLERVANGTFDPLAGWGAASLGGANLAGAESGQIQLLEGGVDGPREYSSFPVRCGCGKIHDAEGWKKLPYPPKGHVQKVPADPTDPVRPEAYELELRNCSCGSTLAIEVEDKGTDGAPDALGDPIPIRRISTLKQLVKQINVYIDRSSRPHTLWTVPVHLKVLDELWRGKSEPRSIPAVTVTGNRDWLTNGFGRGLYDLIAVERLGSEEGMLYGVIYQQDISVPVSYATERALGPQATERWRVDASVMRQLEAVVKAFPRGRGKFVDAYAIVDAAFPAGLMTGTRAMQEEAQSLVERATRENPDLSAAPKNEQGFPMPLMKQPVPKKPNASEGDVGFEEWSRGDVIALVRQVALVRQGDPGTYHLSDGYKAEALKFGGYVFTVRKYRDDVEDFLQRHGFVSLHYLENSALQRIFREGILPDANDLPGVLTTIADGLAPTKDVAMALRVAADWLLEKGWTSAQLQAEAPPFVDETIKAIEDAFKAVKLDPHAKTALGQPWGDDPQKLRVAIEGGYLTRTEMAYAWYSNQFYRGVIKVGSSYAVTERARAMENAYGPASSGGHTVYDALALGLTLWKIGKKVEDQTVEWQMKHIPLPDYNDPSSIARRNDEVRGVWQGVVKRVFAEFNWPVLPENYNPPPPSEWPPAGEFGAVSAVVGRNTTSANKLPSGIKLYFFYQEGCEDCAATKPEVLRFASRHPEVLVKHIDTLTKDLGELDPPGVPSFMVRYPDRAPKTLLPRPMTAEKLEKWIRHGG